MLIQASVDPKGSVKALPIQRPSAAWLPTPWPSVNISRQSPATWFQPASLDSGQSPEASAACKGLMSRAVAVSVLTIAHLIVRRLAVTDHAAREPVGGPIEHSLDRHPRDAELGDHALGIVEPSGGRLGALKSRRPPQAFRKCLGQLPHLERLGAGNVDGARWIGDARQAAQCDGTGIALPNHI